MKAMGKRATQLPVTTTEGPGSSAAVSPSQVTPSALRLKESQDVLHGEVKIDRSLQLSHHG